MRSEIYYFSGTGNSLVVARDLAEKTNGKLIPISSVIDKEKITLEADVTGIVFPVYYIGLNDIPLIIKRFIGKLEGIDTKYIFVACTYGGGFGKTMNIMDDMVRSRGGRLSAGFGVHMPQNAFNKPFENRDKLFNDWKMKKLPKIYEYVNAKREGRFESDGLISRPVVAALITLMNLAPLRPLFIKTIYRSAGFSDNLKLPFAEVMPFLDRSYHVDEKCTGCGICSKVCPVNNIKVVNDKPEWQHHCENCLACVNWCPKKAIHGYGELPKMRRYHHPEVKLADIVRKDQSHN